jgi:hypothetical protein
MVDIGDGERRAGSPERLVAAMAVSDPTGHGDDHGDVDAVRRANAEDARRKINDGTPPVRPAAAAT